MATTDRELALVLDFCLRVGEVLLSSGAGAADVTATMVSLARALEARDAQVDVTFTSLSMSHPRSEEEAPMLATRQVQQRVIDYQDLTRVDHLVRDVVKGRAGLLEARSELRRITSTGHGRRRWAVTGGWAVMSGAVGLALGGDVLVVLLAALSAVLIDRLQLRIARARIPVFYRQVAGGGVASLVAAGAAATGLPVDVSLVVTANIVMLLSGIGFLGALQDALSGFYITAGARITEALLSTAGIIAGVSGGLSVAQTVGVVVPDIEYGVTGIQDASFAVAGAAVSAAAFAFASYSPRRTLLPIAVVAGLAMSISLSIETSQIQRSWSLATAAFFVGLVGYAVAGRLRVPPLVVVVSGVVPMLPGVSIYRGLALVGEGDRQATTLGVVALIGAGTVALALAAGVILGEYVAQPLTREARRVESRLAGPRLVGPLSVRAGGSGGGSRSTAPTPPTPVDPGEAAEPRTRTDTPRNPWRPGFGTQTTTFSVPTSTPPQGTTLPPGSTDDAGRRRGRGRRPRP